MLAEERFEKILSILERDGSVEVSGLVKELAISESTIRRDLNHLDEEGRLVKVHGGAIPKQSDYLTADDKIDNRKNQNVSAKQMIATYAASLIGDDDVVYLDAGSTTDLMVTEHLNKNALYVTNAISHAKRLSMYGCKVYILGGEFKITTEAIVGEEAVLSLEKYNFTKAFIGANGVTSKQGLTTPEPKEAMIKRTAMAHAKEVYILTDESKFDQISTVTFGKLEDATILTDLVPKQYRQYHNIKGVGK